MLALLAAPAFALPLLAEHFDANALPPGWKTSVGAQVGGGAQNEVAFQDGALVLRAEARTKKFTAVSKKVDLRDVRWVRVTFRQRTENVDPSKAKFQNCDLYVKFDTGQLEASRVVTGTTDWTNLTRTFAVPADAHDMELGVFLSMPGVAAFDDIVVEAVDLDWNSQRRGNFVYHWLGRDGFTEDNLTANDDAYDRIAAFVGVQKPVTIQYWRYANLDQIEEFTGVRGNGHVEGDAVHTIWRVEDHEITHILARAWGNPTALLGEGLAVYLSGAWQGKDIRQAARASADAHPDLHLAAMLETRGFRLLPDEETYPVAGAFAKWIAEVKGKETLQKVYAATTPDGTADANRKAIEGALGMKLEDAEAALRAWW